MTYKNKKRWGVGILANVYVVEIRSAGVWGVEVGWDVFLFVFHTLRDGVVGEGDLLNGREELAVVLGDEHAHRCVLRLRVRAALTALFALRLALAAEEVKVREPENHKALFLLACGSKDRMINPN